MLFTEILLALQRGIFRLPNLQAFHHIGGPRRGPGGERKAPWPAEPRSQRKVTLQPPKAVFFTGESSPATPSPKQYLSFRYCL